jgi:hypothetical protein
VLLVSGPERDEPKTILPNEGSHAPPPV